MMRVLLISVFCFSNILTIVEGVEIVSPRGWQAAIQHEGGILSTEESSRSCISSPTFVSTPQSSLWPLLGLIVAFLTGLSLGYTWHGIISKKAESVLPNNDGQSAAAKTATAVVDEDDVSAAEELNAAEPSMVDADGGVVTSSTPTMSEEVKETPQTQSTTPVATQVADEDVSEASSSSAAEKLNAAEPTMSEEVKETQSTTLAASQVEDAGNSTFTSMDALKNLQRHLAQRMQSSNFAEMNISEMSNLFVQIESLRKQEEANQLQMKANQTQMQLARATELRLQNEIEVAKKKMEKYERDFEKYERDLETYERDLEKYKRDLKKEKIENFKKVCRDQMGLGICVMLLFGGYFAWERGVFTELVGKCGAFPAYDKSFFGGGFFWWAYRCSQVMWCYFSGFNNAVLGFSILLAAPYLAYQTNLLSDYQDLPMQKLFIGFGVLCGAAGSFAVGRIDGQPWLWLILWEIWTGSHLVLAMFAHRLCESVEEEKGWRGVARTLLTWIGLGFILPFLMARVALKPSYYNLAGGQYI